MPTVCFNLTKDSKLSPTIPKESQRDDGQMSMYVYILRLPLSQVLM